MVLNCKILIRTYTIYYLGFRYNYVVLKSIYKIGANIKISLYHELAIFGRSRQRKIIEHWKPSYVNKEMRQFSRLAAKYTRAQTVYLAIFKHKYMHMCNHA